MALVACYLRARGATLAVLRFRKGDISKEDIGKHTGSSSVDLRAEDGRRTDSLTPSMGLSRS